MLVSCVRALVALTFTFSFLPGQVALSQKTGQPTPFTIHENLIYIQVLVNGRGPYHFRLDLGASGRDHIDHRLAKELGLKIVGFEENTDGPQVKREFLIRADQLSVGEIAYSNVKLRVGDFNTPDGPIRVDGIIGRDFFSRYLLTLDGPGRQLLVSTGRLEPHGKGVLSYTSAFLVSGQVGPAEMGFNLDTGSALALLFPKASLAGIHYTNTPNQRVVTQATISFVLQEAVISDEIVLGGVRLKDQKVYYSDKAHRINVGEAFLKEHIVTFDQQAKLVRIE